MKKTMVILLLPFTLSLVSGCAYDSPQQQEANACRIIGTKALIGGVAGAAGGAAIGAAAGNGKGAAIGAGIGLLAGLIAGHVADNQDCEAAQAALQSQIMAARTHGTIPWTSKSGHSGEYQVTGDVYAGSNGAQCRNADSVAAGNGTATPILVCRKPNGDYTYAHG